MATAFLAALLAEHIGDLAAASSLVFTSPKGEVLRQSNFYRRIYKPAVIPASLDPALRFHDLRHTAVALMIERGAHPTAIKERLGHSSISITLDTYGHLMASVDASVTDSLDALYRQTLGASV